ncbi:hypothetical protein [Pedobacter sp.]|uniref:hypothetical protein n=1 Tax=Pedobacter sp. TaxID=1411316 RepID=UPI003D7F4BAE
MIKHIFTLVVSFFVAGQMNATAQIKPFIATISTGNDVFKGVLYEVTSDSIGIKKDAEVVYFCPDEIKTIKLREIKRGIRYKKYLNTDSYSEKSFQKVSKKMVPVRKWGEKDPTIEEELSGRIITSFYSTAINGVIASIGLMNGSTNTVNVNYKKENYLEGAKSLAFHSVLYQRSPAAHAELKAQNSKIN